MPAHVASQPKIVHPTLEALVHRYVTVTKLSVAQALLREERPDVYKLAAVPTYTIGARAPAQFRPAAGIIAERIAARGAPARTAAARTIASEVAREPALRRKIATASLNLKASAFLADQVDVVREYGFVNDASMISLYQKIMAGLGVAATVDAAAGTVTTPEASPVVLNRGLKFRLHDVKCMDETNPEWPGSDEIHLGGVTLDDKGVEGKVNEFDVGDFNDGTVKSYPPQILKVFALEGDYKAPKVFSVFVALAEKDAGGFSDFLQKLYDSIKADLQKILTVLGAAAGAWIGTQIGGAIGTAVGGPLGTVIGVVAGAILGALVGWLVATLKDDIFEPQVASIALPAGDATFASGGLVSGLMPLYFTGFGGQYRVRYSWEITR